MHCKCFLLIWTVYQSDYCGAHMSHLTSRARAASFHPFLPSLIGFTTAFILEQFFIGYQLSVLDGYDKIGSVHICKVAHCIHIVCSCRRVGCMHVNIASEWRTRVSILSMTAAPCFILQVCIRRNHFINCECSRDAHIMAMERSQGHLLYKCIATAQHGGIPSQDVQKKADNVQTVLSV